MRKSAAWVLEIDKSHVAYWPMSSSLTFIWPSVFAQTTSQAAWVAQVQAHMDGCMLPLEVMPFLEHTFPANLSEKTYRWSVETMYPSYLAEGNREDYFFDKLLVSLIDPADGLSMEIFNLYPSGIISACFGHGWDQIPYWSLMADPHSGAFADPWLKARYAQEVAEGGVHIAAKQAEHARVFYAAFKEFVCQIASFTGADEIIVTNDFIFYDFYSVDWYDDYDTLRTDVAAQFGMPAASPLEAFAGYAFTRNFYKSTAPNAPKFGLRHYFIETLGSSSR